MLAAINAAAISGAPHWIIFSAVSGWATGWSRSEDTNPAAPRTPASTSAPSAKTTVSAAVQIPVSTPARRVPESIASATIVSASIEYCSNCSPA